MSDKAISLGTSPAEEEKFSFSKDIDGVKKTVRGEKVENGWIITIEKEWKEKNPINDTEEWKFNSWKYISKDNPLDKLRKKDGKNDNSETGFEADISNAIRDIAQDQGMLLVD